MPNRDRPSDAPPPTASPETAPKPGRRFGRRGFLQIGFLGAAGASLTTACASTPTAQPAPADPRPTPSTLLPAAESWNEPWVWEPSAWPGQPLQLNVVENQSTGAIIGFGNPNGQLFSWGGQTPGPTIRMRGDETLRVQLRNLLGPDDGTTAIGPNPDPNELTPDINDRVKAYESAHPGVPLGRAVHEVIGNDLRDDYCLGEHTNGVHSAHVTNLHTHGLHVRPYKNPDGTHSDNVILRVLPQGDLARREQGALSPACTFLRNPEQDNFLTDDEQVGLANYEFRIGDVQGDPDQPHPPGTHWYHPHCHGATHNQVASGMAGFLIVEGDVDQALNQRLTGRAAPSPTLKTGDWDYRERLMLVQRVFFAPADPDAPPQRRKDLNEPSALVNGNVEPPVITMRPGAVERWRMLNGSVDGRGFKRMMVLKGLYSLDANKKLAKWNGSAYVTAPYQTIEDDKQDLALLALDGITLVEEAADGSRYAMRDLSRQNAGTANPLAATPATTNADLLRNFQSVFADGASIRDTWVRPNEVFFGPANRADVVFQAPALDGGQQTVTVGNTSTTGELYTVVAKAVVVHADNSQQTLQQAVAAGPGPVKPGPQDIIVAHLVVKGDPCPPFDVMSLEADLPPVPPYLRPITDDELAVTPVERAARRAAGKPDGPGFRTRTVTYSGWGSQDFPLTTTDPDDPSHQAFQAFIDENPDLRGLVYAENGGVDVLMPAALRTMAIDGRKFNPTDPDRPRMLLDSAEEWTLYNLSSMLWGDTSETPPGQYGGHYRPQIRSRIDGERAFAQDPNVQIVTKGVDHPFHMHQNPFWVTRIEIPDQNGDLHNILDRPQWMDAAWIPRHRGRVVFRARFPDFVGTYVHHCHILLHEDNGMMTPVEVTPFAEDADFVTRDAVFTTATPADVVDRATDRPDRRAAYLANSQFVDTNHATGQVYPGFAVSPPRA